MKKIIVVGAGASGIMAAGQAALAGCDVLLLEKKEKPGKKILISGKGRCNLTNDSDLHDFLSHFNRSGRFLHQPFSRFFVPQLIEFFNELGLPLVTERGGRVFPESGKADQVLITLIRWLESAGATLQCNSKVTKLLVEDDKITGVECNGKKFFADSVILSTGGATYPATGSSGDGYNFAKLLGHKIIPLRPALVPLEIKDNALKSLKGLDLRNSGVRIYINKKRKISDFGEVSFTGFGIGGPVILTHSRFVVDNLEKGKTITISLDLKPALDESKLDARLLRDFSGRKNEHLSSILRGLLPKQLVEVCLLQTNIDGSIVGEKIKNKQRIALRSWLKDFRFDISGHRPLREGIVTAGGIQVKEVNPNTMESLKIKNLYLTGEILDIDADTGGYNLQAAFSTGWVAGREAASKEK